MRAGSGAVPDKDRSAGYSKRAAVAPPRSGHSDHELDPDPSRLTIHRGRSGRSDLPTCLSGGRHLRDHRLRNSGLMSIANCARADTRRKRPSTPSCSCMLSLGALALEPLPLEDSLRLVKNRKSCAWS